MDTFFTSDHHFGHRGILRYCARPFADTDEMDSHLIARWNDRIGAEDVVFLLGSPAGCSARCGGGSGCSTSASTALKTTRRVCSPTPGSIDSDHCYAALRCCFSHSQKSSHH
jgi:hypothetical protein